jgi:hypothetical protein
MKKLKLTGKLSLNKETVTKLTEEQLAKLNGGICNYTQNGRSCTGGSGTNATNSPGMINCCL